MRRGRIWLERGGMLRNDRRYADKNAQNCGYQTCPEDGESIHRNQQFRREISSHRVPRIYLTSLRQIYDNCISCII
jgi:hypothetical protein